MNNFAILSPFAGFSKLVKSICREIKEEITVLEVTGIETHGIEAIKIAEKLQNEGCKAILAKNFTSSFIKGKISVPVIALEIEPFDLLQSIYNVSLSYKKIGYIGFWEDSVKYDFGSFEKILGVEIYPFPYITKEDVLRQVKRAVEKNVDVVLATGICIAEACKSFGLAAKVIYPSKNSIIQGINRAKEIIAMRQREIEYNQQLWTLVNAAYDGVLLVDSDDRVAMINPQAEQILDMSADEILGKSTKTIRQLLNVQDINKDKVVKIGEHYLVIKRIPFKRTGGSARSVITFRDVSEVQKLEQQIRKEMWEKGLKARFKFDHIIGKSSIIKITKNQAMRYAQSNSTILIIGESGTGKELFAQSIHNASSRKSGPFVAVNCAAFPETLLDSELFGYDKGAFTGADKRGKPGLFELAHRGTIFLDEISDLPFSLQAKLLRVLQEKEVRRISGEKIIPVDVRVIAATNKDLTEEVKKGSFREDLYYRLNVLTLRIPPLRERKDDIGELLNYFLDKYSKQLNRKVCKFTENEVARFNLYNWPGNIRELENFIEKYVLLYEEGNKGLLEQLLVEKFSLNVAINKIEDPDVLQIRLGTLEEIEYQIFTQLIEKYKMEKGRIAQLLGISRTTLWKKLKKNNV